MGLQRVLERDACAALLTLCAPTPPHPQPLFSKPKLTEKLLAKPPFRFLHDIILALIKTAGTGLPGTCAAKGFAAGLYAGEELDGEAVGKSKEAKCAFLDKAINFVGIILNTHCATAPRAVIAGACCVGGWGGWRFAGVG